jgi:hypothetical protein
VFDNHSDDVANINITFDSGVTKTFRLQPNEHIEATNIINKGTWTAVDPIKSFSVSAKAVQTIMNKPAKTVEVRSYTIEADGSVARTQ